MYNSAWLAGPSSSFVSSNYSKDFSLDGDGVSDGGMNVCVCDVVYDVVSVVVCDVVRWND